MAKIEDQVKALRPHTSLQGLHDFIFGNLFLEVSEYGDDNNVEHMERAYAWQKELGQVLSEKASASTKDEPTPKAPTKK